MLNFQSWHECEPLKSWATLAFLPCLGAAAFTIVSYWVLRFLGFHSVRTVDRTSSRISSSVSFGSLLGGKKSLSV